MDISGLIQSYDSRATSSPALTRTVMAPQYVQSHPYPRITNNTVASNQQIQHNPFSFSSYSGGTPTGLVPTFTNVYVQQHPLPRLMQPSIDRSGGIPFARSNRQGFVEERQNRSPSIKQEPLWSTQIGSPTFAQIKNKTAASPPPNGPTDINFGTEVDTLMKTIQAKSQTAPPQTSSPADQSKPVLSRSFTPPRAQPISQIGREGVEESKFKLTPGDDQDDAASPKSGKKRYQCTIENCSKSFYQKTHLDIHVRAHTGDKPYPCSEPGCGRSFSQLGNLKTHERRHTGERPYACETCGKRFAQRGNVRAHKTVHDQAKPYLCRLDDCGKHFTQLGNLKSHQNKFHIATIRNLTSKFASIKDGDIVNAADKEIWEYFANLYKNSNKGIKGRGKDRKVGHHSLDSSMRSMGMSGRGYGMGGAGRGNMVVGVAGSGSGMRGARAGRGETRYEIFDADNESQAGSHSGGGSSVGTCYDDAPSDGFEEGGRTGELAFGDRIY